MFKVLSYFKRVMGTPSCHLQHRPFQILLCKSDCATALPMTSCAAPVDRMMCNFLVLAFEAMQSLLLVTLQLHLLLLQSPEFI